MIYLSRELSNQEDVFLVQGRIKTITEDFRIKTITEDFKMQTIDDE